MGFDIEYSEYLKTKHWQDFRKDALAYYGHKCFNCGATNTQMHVHHRTYENIGEEKIEDVIVLCKKCHYSEHFSDKPPKYKKPSCWHDEIVPMVFRNEDIYKGIWYCRQCCTMLTFRSLTPKEKRFILKHIEKRKKQKRHRYQCECIEVQDFSSLPKKYKKELPLYCRAELTVGAWSR